MKRKLLITVAMQSSFAVCDAATDISDKWTGNLVKADSTYYPLNYNFSMNNVQNVLGKFPIASGKVYNHIPLHFKVAVNRVSILPSSKLYGDYIERILI